MYKVYIDENGDNGLNFDKAGTKRQFIITAVIVKTEIENSIIEKIEEISSTHLRGAEIKSKRIREHDKRQKVLKEIRKLDIQILCLIVNKQYLPNLSEGYGFKRVFYKNIPNKIYSYLKALLDEAEIIPDPVGDKEFQEELKNYVINKNPIDLFNQSSFRFSPAKENRITQIADLISGSIAKYFSGEKQFYETIRDKIAIRSWPRSTSSLPQEIQNETNQYDDDIAQSAFSLANHFLEKNPKPEDHVTVDQCRLLELLIFELVNGNPNRYIPSHTLRRSIEISRKGSKIGDYYFRTKVIGKLRSSDVMIVSNRKGGYKIPVSLNEINEYLLNLNEKVQPMIERVDMLRRHVKIKTGKDILERDDFKFLRTPKEPA